MVIGLELWQWVWVIRIWEWVSGNVYGVGAIGYVVKGMLYSVGGNGKVMVCRW